MRFTWACLLLILAEANGQQTPSNLQFLQQAFRQCAVRAASVIKANEEPVFVVAHSPVTQEEVPRLLYHALVEVLKSEKNAEVFTKNEVIDQAITLEYKLLQLDFTYTKLAHGSQLRRQAKLLVDFDIHHTQNSLVYFQGLIETIQADTVNGKIIAQLENPALPFTRGVWENKKNGRGWIEPLLLTAATGAVIYAFYTLRSK